MSFVRNLVLSSSCRLLILALTVSAALAIGLTTWRSVAAQQATLFVTASAASYRFDSIASESIVAGFGVNLSTQSASGTDTDTTTPGIQLPTTLVGTTVRVNGVAAPLFYVSPGQINYLIPAVTPLGDVPVTVTTASGATAAGTINVRLVAPAIFAANADGRGVPAAQLLRVAANNVQTYEPLSARNEAANRILATPINLGPEGERVFLILYPTGLRRVPDPNGDGNRNEFTRVIINGLSVVPAYAGPQGSLVGLDQVNVEIPRTLLGSGALDVQIVVNGFGLSNTTGVELVAPPVTGLSFRPLGLPNRTIRAFTTIGSYLFAATNQGVWCSSDSGANWVNVSSGLPTNADVRTLFVDGPTLYAGLYGGGGVCVSTNNGGSWTALNNGLVGSTLNISNLLFFGGSIYAATQGGVCRYVNGAWVALNTGLSNVDATTLVIAGGRLCVGTRGGGIFLLGSGNSGWGSISNGLPSGAQVLSLVSAGTAVYAGLNGGGLCVSRNGGTSWTQVAGGLPTSAVINSIWIDGVRCYVGTATGVYVTNDSGVSWSLLSNGLSGCSGANNTNAVFAFASRLLTGSTGCGVYGSALAAGPNNRAPIAYDQTVSFTEDTPIVISLSGFDADLDPLTYSIVAGPARGSLNGALPNITYTPDINFNGRTAFTFRVNDGRANSNTATISLEGSPINDAPVLVVPGAQTVTVNQAVTFTISATDPDAGQTVTLGTTGLPSGATFNSATGAFAWTPTVVGGFTLTFSATDNGTPVLTNTRTVSVTVNAPQGNRPPVAIAQSIQMNEDTVRQITLTGSDADANPLTFAIVTQPANGALSGTAPNLNYTPAANFAGNDSFTFKVNDGMVDSPAATISISVAQVNDAPVLIVPGALSVTAGQNVNFKLDVIDPDKAQGQTYVYSSNNLPQGATITADQGNQTATFNWTPGTNGATTINFTVTDAGTLSDTKTVTITASGPTPIGNWINIKGNLAASAAPSHVAATADRLYAGNGQGLFSAPLSGGNISGDWTPFNTGAPFSNQTSLFSLQIIGNKLYADTRYNGLFVSELGTPNFTRVGTPFFQQSGGGRQYASVNFIFGLNGLLYAGFSEAVYGVHVSSDEGATWSRLTSGLPTQNFTPTDYALVGNTIYVLYQNHGIYRSVNGGISWTNVSASLPSSGQGLVGTITANGATLFCASYVGAQTQWGIYRSLNGGGSWTQMTTAAPFSVNFVRDLISANGLLFAAVEQAPVQFSSDNGLTWRAMDAGAAPLGTQIMQLASADNFIVATGSTLNNPAISVLPSAVGNSVPQLTVPAAQTATVGTQLSFQISATDADAGQTLTYQVSSLPLGATFSANSRTFNWTPAVAGQYTVGFTVTDNGTPVLSQAKTVNITVNPPVDAPNGFWTQSNTGLLAAGPVRYWASVDNKLFAATETGKVMRLDSGIWVNANNGLTPLQGSNSLTIFGFTSGGNNLYLLTERGVHRSTDQGANWTKPANASFDVPDGFSQYGSLAVSGNTVWVATQQYSVGGVTHGFMLRSTDGGVNWIKGGTGLNQVLYSLFPLGNSLFGGSFSYLTRSTNGGGNFAQSTYNPQVRGFAAAGQTIFVGASDGNGVYRSFDNGGTWNAVNNGLPANPIVRSLHYSAPFLFAGTSQGVYYSLDLGANWQTINNGDTPSSTQDVFVFDGKVYAATGDARYNSPNTTYQGVYVSPLPTISGNTAPTITVNDTYAGTTGAALNFTVAASAADSGQTVALTAANLPQGATFTAATGAFAWTPQAAGTYTLSFTATDNGTPALSVTKTVTLTVTGNAIVGNWTNLTGGGLPVNVNIRQLAEYDGEIFISTNTGVYKTNNGGTTWTKASTGLGTANSSVGMLAVANNTLYATSESTQALFASTDSGVSWEQVGSGNTAPLYITSIVYSGNALIAAGLTSVYVSTNFGQTWATVTSGLGTNNRLSQLVVKGTSVFGTSTGPFSGNAGVYRSDNNGAAWTAAGTGLVANSVYQILLVKGTNVYTLTNLAPLYTTANNGTSWTEITSNLPSQALYELEANDQLMFVAGSQGTYFSSTNGTSWTTMNIGASVTSARSLLIVGNKLYATTNTGIFVSPLPGTTGQ